MKKGFIALIFIQLIILISSCGSISYYVYEVKNISDSDLTMVFYQDDQENINITECGIKLDKVYEIQANSTVTLVETQAGNFGECLLDFTKLDSIQVKLKDKYYIFCKHVDTTNPNIGYSFVDIKTTDKYSYYRIILNENIIICRDSIIRNYGN